MRQYLAILCLTIICVLDFQCPVHASDKAKSIKIGTFSVAADYAPYLIARKMGWLDEAFEKIGYTPEYIDPFQSLAPINEGLATGSVDFVLAAETPLIIGKASGIDDKIVWYSCATKLELLIPVSSHANNLTDLKNKHIAGLSGTSAHFGFMDNLKKSGLKSNEVSFVPMPPPEAKAAFETGSVDGWTVWPPFVEQEIIAIKGKPLPGYTAYAQVVMVGRSDFMKDNSKVTSALISTLDRARAWIVANPEQAQSMMSEELHLPSDVIKLAWPRLDWSASLNDKVIADMQEKADFLKELGLIKNAVSVKHDFIIVPSQSKTP